MEELQQLRERKIITLIGRLITPIVLSKPFIKKHGCWIRVVGDPKTDTKPIFVSVGKLVKGEQRVPTTLRGYRGYVKVTCVGASMPKMKQRVSVFLQKRFLGNLTSEGYGKIIWEECLTEIYQPKHRTQYKKFKIRKGLGINYPEELQRLIIALMLHDFVHTEKHPSKIFQQVTIEDEVIRDACLNHHNETRESNPYHSLIQYYDRLASHISRRKPYRTVYRYDKVNGQINFQRLAQDIEGIQQSAYKLYNYIYYSKELTRIIESLDYGKNPLRNHLLLMVNLAINDYYDKKIKIIKGKLKITEKKLVSSSATKSEEVHSSVCDAEMHQFPAMSNADSESPTNSKKRRLGT